MDRNTTVTALQAAVAKLKGDMVIRKENEISVLTGFSKSAVSGFLSGNTTPSKAFLQKFQEVFKLRLEDFIKEKPVQIDFSHGVGLETLIRTESKADVTLSYVAEIYAHLKEIPATKVLRDMEQMADVQSLNKLAELKKK